jgi:hypothetical protein
MLVWIGITFLVLIGICTYALKKVNMSNSGQYADLSSVLNNVIIALSIVCTGIWTISTFDLLNQREMAATQLKELRNKAKDIESSKIEISTEIVEYKGAYPDSGKKGLIVNIKIKNQGNSAIDFNLKDFPLKVYQIEADDTDVGYTKQYELNVLSKVGKLGDKKELFTRLDNLVSLVSSEKVLSYFAVLPKNKMYYIVFSLKAHDTESIDEANCQVNECKWFASKYIYLK